MKTIKNEIQTHLDLLIFIKTNKKYSKNWTLQKTNNIYIQKILNQTSKKKTGHKGFPDLLYVNENKKLFIFVENKANIKDHISKDGHKPSFYAVDGIQHY